MLHKVATLPHFLQIAHRLGYSVEPLWYTSMGRLFVDSGVFIAGPFVYKKGGQVVIKKGEKIDGFSIRRYKNLAQPKMEIPLRKRLFDYICEAA